MISKQSLAALAGILVALFFLAWNLGWVQTGKAEAAPAIHIGCADLQRGCNILFNGQHYVLRSAAPLSGAHPVDLTLEGAQDIKAASASWQMQRMDMGPNVFHFVRRGERWQVQSALPLCSENRQDWLLTLRIDDFIVLINTVSER